MGRRNCQRPPIRVFAAYRLIWTLPSSTNSLPLAIWGRPIALSDTVVTNLILLFGGIIGSYVFGAIWDQKGKRKADIAESTIEQADDANINADIEVKT